MSPLVINQCKACLFFNHIAMYWKVPVDIELHYTTSSAPHAAKPQMLRSLSSTEKSASALWKACMGADFVYAISARLRFNTYFSTIIFNKWQSQSKGWTKFHLWYTIWWTISGNGSSLKLFPYGVRFHTVTARDSLWKKAINLNCNSARAVRHNNALLQSSNKACNLWIWITEQRRFCRLWYPTYST